MIIRRIILQNIRSYEELDLELPNGSILLAGDIGTGKTTILLAIEFALFGLQPGQRGNSLLRHGTEEGKVVLDIEVENSRISISRMLKRTSKTVSQENPSITIDGKIEELSVSELKNKVLAILDYPGEFAKKTNLLYRFTVYTPQEEM
ncbi:MAG: AAA family ATPase, partial [Nanoarchaeota archaeon]